MFSLIASSVRALWDKYTQVCQLSVLILGPPSSGKTTLFLALKESNNQENSTARPQIDNQTPTTGVNFTKLIATEQNATLSVTDLGRSLYTFWPEYVGEEDVILYVFDGTNLDQLEHIREFLPSLIERVEEVRPHPPRLIFVSNTHNPETSGGNAGDNTILHTPPHPRIIHQLHTLLLKGRLSCPVLFCSAKTGEGIDLLLERIVKEGHKKKEGIGDNKTDNIVPNFRINPAVSLNDHFEQLVIMNNRNNSEST